MLSEVAILEFKRLYESDTGIIITYEEALSKATEFVSFIKIFIKSNKSINNTQPNDDEN